MNETTDLALALRRVFLPIIKEAFENYMPPPVVQVPEPETLLTATQGAEDVFQVSLPTFRKWEKEGYFQPRIIGGEKRYPRSELIAAAKRPEIQRVTKRKR